MNVGQVNNKNSFGHKLILDSGASNQNKGSLKMSVVSDSGQEIECFKSVVCLDGFKQDGDYLKGFQARIIEVYKKCKNEIAKFSNEDKSLNGIIIYAPGPTVNNTASILPNLRLPNGDSLKNIDYNQLPDMLRSKLPNVKISPNIKLFAINDMIGAGAAIADNLNENGLLKNGYMATYFMAGGGLGAGDIEVINNKAVIKTSEIGHMRVSGNGKNIIGIGSYGASSTALIRNFGKALGYKQEEIDKLIRTGNAKIATQYQVVTKDKSEARNLDETGMFIRKQLGDEISYTLKGVTESQHKNAFLKSVNKFVETMAIVSTNKILEGTNHLIFTGPLLEGIDNGLKNKNLGSIENLIKKKTHSFLTPVGKTMAKDYDVKFSFDIPLANNTQSGLTVLKGKYVGKGRGNWVEIPLKALKRSLKNI